MKKHYVLLFFTFLFVFVRAQDTTITLTLNKALQMGLDSSKSLKISTARLQLAEAKYKQAADATIPSVRLTAGYTRLSDIDEPKFLFPGATEPVSLFPVYVNNYYAGVSVSETVFSGFRLKYARESQKLLRDAAKFDDAKEKNEVAFAITSAFFNLFKLRVSEKVVAQNLLQMKERIRETELGVKNGIATKNDLLRWQLQQSNLELTQIDIRNNISIANFNLNLMLGMSGNLNIMPDSNSVTTETPIKSISDYMNDAEKRSDLSSSDLKSKAAYNLYRVSKNSYLPRISLNGEFLDARPNQRYIPPVDKFNTTWSAGVVLNWDLVSIYSNRHNNDEYHSLYRQSQDSYNLLSDAIKLEINQNYLLMNESKEKEQLMNKTVALANDNYRLMDSRFRNSLVTISDLLEANNQLITAEINLAIAKADIQIAYYRLLKSSGTITSIVNGK